MTKEERIKEILNRFQESLDDLIEEVGEDNINFVAGLCLYDDTGEVTDNSKWWSVGDIDTCVIAAECLLEDIKKEKEDIITYSLN